MATSFRSKYYVHIDAVRIFSSANFWRGPRRTGLTSFYVTTTAHISGSWSDDFGSYTISTLQREIVRRQRAEIAHRQSANNERFPRSLIRRKSPWVDRSK